MPARAVPPVTPTDVDRHATDIRLALPAAGPDADRFQRVHDHGLIWHLRYKEVPLLAVILISWGLAFFEYCLAVPANRWAARSKRGATQDDAGSDHARRVRGLSLPR